MESEKTYSESSSSAEIPTPTTSGPPSPRIPPVYSQTSSSTPPPPPETHQHILLAFSAIYPLTIILGSLFSFISPTGRSASYFSQKGNVFNVLFVKIGWFWTTAAFLVHVFNLRHPNQSQARSKALIRYGLATVAWILVTQWFFGPPLMDRTFTLTGGMCRPNPSIAVGASESLGDRAEGAISSVACKIAGGTWDGGHDLSGHTFMLTHASLFLWAEMLPRLLDSRRRRGGSSAEYMGVHWFVWSILVLWWWMLLMTSIYFHTWTEKVTGWAAAVIEWTVLYIYVLPRNPWARQTFGVPVI